MSKTCVICKYFVLVTFFSITIFYGVFDLVFSHIRIQNHEVLVMGCPLVISI